MKDERYHEVMEAIENLAAIFKKELLAIHEQIGGLRGEIAALRAEVGLLAREMREMKEMILNHERRINRLEERLG